MLSPTRTAEFVAPRLHNMPPSSRTRSQRAPRSTSSTVMDATHASTSRLSSMSSPSPTIASCLSPSSAFYQVLTAPYRPYTHLRLDQSTSTNSRQARLSIESVDWTRGSDMFPLNGDDQTDRDHATNLDDNDRGLRINQPHDRWAWANGLLLERTETLMKLPCTFLTFLTL